MPNFPVLPCACHQAIQKQRSIPRSRLKIFEKLIGRFADVEAAEITATGVGNA
jgi:hypothetical protein